MLLDRMVHLETSGLRRLAHGREEVEIRFGRLLRNPRVDVAQIIAGWSAETAPAAAGRHVLAIQDSSEIHFRTTESHRRGLGLIGKGVGRGILLHPMSAVDAASGEGLGLVGGALWTRPQPAALPASSQQQKKRNQQRLLNEKEARHWIETAQAAKPVLAAAATITMIADQEADLDPFWARVPDSNVDVLGRVDHDRKLATGGTLTTAACRWPVLGTRRLTRRKREDRPEREAELELRAGSVTLLRPRGTCDPGLPKPVTLTLIELSEPNPPAGAAAVTWRLLTTHAAPDAASPWQIVDGYQKRWMIEQFFRTLKKQGWRIEDSQVETADGLIKLVAIAARAAVIIMQLTQARDGASSLNAPSSSLQPKSLRSTPSTPPTVAPRAILTPTAASPGPRGSSRAAAGGPSTGSGGRPSAPPPGPITFKHGLEVLQSMAKGWELRDLYTP